MFIKCLLALLAELQARLGDDDPPQLPELVGPPSDEEPGPGEARGHPAPAHNLQHILPPLKVASGCNLPFRALRPQFGKNF